MAPAAIHIVPEQLRRLDRARQHWAGVWALPTREEAEFAAEPLARKRAAELIVHLPDGRMSRKSFKRGWTARLLEMIGRN